MMKLRQVFLALLLCILLPVQAYPAGVGNAVGDNITFTGNARFAIPDGDFCIGGWVQAESTSVSASFSRLVRVDNGLGDFNFGITSGGIGAAYDGLTMDSDDDDGTAVAITGTTSDFASVTTPKYVAVERTGNTLNIYVGTSVVATTTNSSYDGVSSGTPILILFNQSSLNRGFNGKMWDWAMWTTPCTYISSLSQGWTPLMFPANRSWYEPLTENSNEIQAGSANTPTSITFEPNPAPSIQPVD